MLLKYENMFENNTNLRIVLTSAKEGALTISLMLRLQNDLEQL